MLQYRSIRKRARREKETATRGDNTTDNTPRICTHCNAWQQQLVPLEFVVYILSQVVKISTAICRENETVNDKNEIYTTYEETCEHIQICMQTH